MKTIAKPAAKAKKAPAMATIRPGKMAVAQHPTHPTGIALRSEPNEDSPMNIGEVPNGAYVFALKSENGFWLVRFQTIQGFLRPQYLARLQIVIGITGCSRSGKGWTSNELQRYLGDHGYSTAVVGQDDYWVRSIKVTTASGRKAISEEAPECTDHESFAAAIRELLETHDVVIAEGFQLVYSPSVTNLLTHIFTIDIDKAEAKRRRCQPTDKIKNPNPMSELDFEELVWPTHERYEASSLALLGSRVVRFDYPKAVADVQAIVGEMLRRAGLAAS